MKLRPVIVIIFISIIFIANIVYAVNKDNMDVVLVMDSTGSMKKTDPRSLRMPAAKLFISLLDKNDLAGVISFNDSAAALSPLISLDSENSKNMLFQSIDKISSTGLHTNLYEALNKGLEVLSAEKKTGREKIMVLMSDGLMDTGDPEKDKTLIEKIKTELTKMLIDNGIKVYAIAFTEQSDRLLLEKVSKQTGGFYNLALTDKDFHVVFTSIFENLKTPDMLPMSENGFLIDKSVEEVTIVATKDSPDTTIQLNSQDGKKYSFRNKPPDSEWFVSSNFDMMTMKKPVEGKWEILFSTGKNNKAYVITNLNLQTNFNELYPLFGQTLDIKVWLEREGKPIEEKEVLEKILLSLELSKPDGETTRLQPFDKGDGIFERKIELYTAGNYKLRILADGKTFQREKAFSFKVADAKESREDIKLRQSVKKPEGQILPKDNTADEIHWGNVMARFIIINLVLGIAALVYLKRNSLKNISDIKKLLKLNAIKGLVKKMGKEPVPQEMKKGQAREKTDKGNKKEQEHAEKEAVQTPEEHKEMEGKKRAMSLDENQKINTAAETKIQETENREEKQDIEPEAEVRNDMPKDQEAETLSEDLRPQVEQDKNMTAKVQGELNDEAHEDRISEQEPAVQYEEKKGTDVKDPGLQETTDKEVDKVNEQEQQENLEELIEQMEKEQQETTDKKGKENDTS
ncbi:MAG: VWA domain-containing protein [Nitrospirae bacterium]|nr:VWA domain-containing protein [Nitrospirota bacterium]